MAVTAVPRHVRAFVGRESELVALSRFVHVDADRVAFLHGVAGIGKSALLRGFVHREREMGTTTVELDCRMVEPTERGFLHALGGCDDLESFTTKLRATSTPTVLTLATTRSSGSWTRGCARSSSRRCRRACTWCCPAASGRSRAGSRSTASRRTLSGPWTRRTPRPCSGRRGSVRATRPG